MKGRGGLVVHYEHSASSVDRQLHKRPDPFPIQTPGRTFGDLGGSEHDRHRLPVKNTRRLWMDVPSPFSQYECDVIARRLLDCFVEEPTCLARHPSRARQCCGFTWIEASLLKGASLRARPNFVFIASQIKSAVTSSEGGNRSHHQRELLPPFFASSGRLVLTPVLDPAFRWQKERKKENSFLVDKPRHKSGSSDMVDVDARSRLCHLCPRIG